MKLSPMMEQYMAIKDEYQDCILFFRLGDFYEMFFDDAKLASKELELTLTGKNCGQEERAPMCGVPFHSAESYIAKLVENGLRPDVIVLDPPRKGCDPAVLQAIIAAAPKRVVYVSCGTPTLARDAKLLAEGGYAAERVQCVDMFCWTGAVETVMVLSKLSNTEQTRLQ
jgi:hypothetical protein